MRIVRCHSLTSEITKALQTDACPVTIQDTSWGAVGYPTLIETVLTAKGASFQADPSGPNGKQSYSNWTPNSDNEAS